MRSKVLKIPGLPAADGRMAPSLLERFLMRGKAARQASMLTAVILGDLVSQSHPIRRIKPIVDRVLAQLPPTFDRMYADNGRASIPRSTC